MIDSNNQLKTLSQSLLAAARGIMEAKKTNKHGHDAVGHEDADIDNDGDVDASDSYLHNRRKAIAKSMKKEEAEQIDEVNANQIKKDLDSGMSHDAVIGKHANKRITNTDAIRKVIKQHAWDKRMKNEEVEELDELSSDTLKSYRTKARAQGNKIVDKMKMGGGDWSKDQKDTQTLRKRSKGAIMSGKQLVKRGESLKTEEVEAIDEAKREHVATVGDWHIHHSEDPNSGEDIYHFKHKTTGKSGGYMLVDPYFNRSKETHSQSVHRQAKSWGASDEEAKHIVSHQNKLLGKSESYQIDEALDAAARYGQHHAAIKELMKSISQHIDNHKSDALKHRDYRGKKGVHWGHVGDLADVHSQLANIHDRLAQQGEYKKTIGEEVELDEAPVDGVAAGSMNNDGHLCATKVFHKEWAEGTPIKTMHADPDENGLIEWYDVMFDHGIERVMTEDMEILQQESHMHSKRGMKKEDVDQIDELSHDTLRRYRMKAKSIADHGPDPFYREKGRALAVRKSYGGRMAGIEKAKVMAKEDIDLEEARGRPRKNPLPAGEKQEPEANQHIMQQLQRAKLSMRGGEKVTFGDGTSHHVPGAHAANILSKYAGMRPSEKEAFQKKISASHAAFKQEV